MVPFKNYFLGSEEPPSPRAVSVQKCMRVSGKHNDLENVGPSHRHHTFFEMLGNFSFGDYFKEEAIRFGWELVTEVWGLQKETLWATVFEEDDEAADLWKRIAGLPSERVLRCGAKDNFWAMGDTGPCGPCSEIFVDLRPGEGQIDWHEGTESGRYVELWNLVFMQFERQEDGRLVPLPDPSIDTGAGLERVAATIEGFASNYDSDLFRPILAAAAELAGVEYGRRPASDIDLRVIADHLRAVCFLLADGVIPSNEGRGYVLRRLLRRAVRHGMGLGFEEPFLNRLIPVVTELMTDVYEELGAAEEASRTTVEAEERKFLDTVAIGSKQVQEAVEAALRSGSSELSGEAIFRFYDTHGLPLELVREIAEEEGLTLDEKGFEKELERQRRRSRAALGDSQKRLAAARTALAETTSAAVTEFVGYSRLRLPNARVIALAGLAEASAVARDELAEGEEGVAVLDRTPFYAEAGGQVGDRGRLSWEGGEGEVMDIRKEDSVYFHFLRVNRGNLGAGAVVDAEVDSSWRSPTQRNHTATHLLHAALRYVLGPGVRQAGSLVAPDRLRFDFTYGEPLTKAQIREIEDLVNRWILSSRETVVTEDRGFEEAVDSGAMALFGEKYGDKVRTVEISPLEVEGESLRSLELCGGCHVRNSGEIGLFVVTSERGVASGVRRIEARTGEGAQELVRERFDRLEQVGAALDVGEDQIVSEMTELRESRRRLERELSRLRMRLVAGRQEGEGEVEVAGIKVVAREVPQAPANEIRDMVDVLKRRLGSGVVVLGARDASKVNLVAAVTGDLTGRIDAGRLANKVAALVGGKGGGRRDFAQAGGRLPERLPLALETVPELVRGELDERPGRS
jgi:alanyl-tRNA synthetase